MNDTFNSNFNQFMTHLINYFMMYLFNYGTLLVLHSFLLHQQVFYFSGLLEQTEGQRHSEHEIRAEGSQRLHLIIRTTTSVS